MSAVDLDIEAHEAFWDTLQAILEEAVPSSTPGSTAGLGALNTLISEGRISADAIQAAASSVAQSGIENVGCVVSFISNCIELHNERTGENRDMSAVKTRAADMIDSLAKLGTGGYAIAETIAALVEKQGGSEVPAALGASAATYAGAALGFANTARTGRRGTHSERRFLRLVNLKQEVVVQAKQAKLDPKQIELLFLLDYAIAKVRRRGLKQWSSVVAGLLGSSSTVILTAVAATAAANFWNPVGWTLFGLGTAAGVALISYTTIRHFTKKHRRKHRAKKGGPKNVEEFANRLLTVFENKSNKHTDWQEYAFKMLQIFHIKVTDQAVGVRNKYALGLKVSPGEAGYPVAWGFSERAKAGARKRIRRHLKG